MLVDQLAEARVAVAECVHGDTRGEIDVSPVLEVPEVASGALGENGHGPGVGRYHVLFVVGNHACGARVRRGVGIGEPGFALGNWSAISELEGRSRKTH